MAAAELRDAYKALQLVRNDLSLTKERLQVVEKEYVEQTEELESLRQAKGEGLTTEWDDINRRIESIEQCIVEKLSVDQEECESRNKVYDTLTKLVDIMRQHPSEWKEDENEIENPVPTFGLRSMEVEHVLQSWTTDETKRQYVREWLRTIASNQLTMESAVEFTDLSCSVLNGFRILVVPLLRQHSNTCVIKVQTKQVATSEDPEEQRWDLRLWAVPKHQVKETKSVSRLSIIQQRLAQLQGG